VTVVAFFGVGAMGREMAAHLISDGHGLCLYSRTASKAERLARVGGEPEPLDDAKDTLSAYSRRIIHFSPVGTGTAYKVMVNLMDTASAPTHLRLPTWTCITTARR
jgi:3-hydroxyisobutyrate dehydrogenase-like beta-hydroxyacid dehydrogenase